jgi:hypothetical protein
MSSGFVRTRGEMTEVYDDMPVSPSSFLSFLMFIFHFYSFLLVIKTPTGKWKNVISTRIEIYLRQTE